jgi:glutaredoxin
MAKSPAYVSTLAKESLLDQFADFLHRYSVGIVLTTGLVFNVYEAMYPSPVFSSRAERRAFFESIRAPESRVITFVTSWCAACRHLEEQLIEEKIPYTKVDIEAQSAARELFDRMSTLSGSRGIPKVVVDDNLTGRSVREIELALEKSPAPQQNMLDAKR